MSKIRAFIACDIPELLLDKAAGLQEKLKTTNADVSWTKIRGVHITLSFLGDIEESLVESIASLMSEAVAGRNQFDLEITGGGAFPNLRNPRVVWLGVKDKTGGLSGIQQELEDRLKALGFEPEEREFRPHLTLGRVKGPKGKDRLSSAVSELREVEIGSFTVDRIMLYRSDLKPTGAVYTKLKEVILQ